MSPAYPRRFVVTGFDHDEWRIVVSALNRDEAVRKAEAIYFADGLGPTGAADFGCSFVRWQASPVRGEVRS